MESMKMKIFLVAMVVAMMMAAQNVAADVEAPAPGPSADAATFVPAVFASVVAAAFGVNIEEEEEEEEGYAVYVLR
ncbi:Arabinogalactan peptide 12 [Striga hermonthica]|uniref:Arabinogalactan peptide 12 n=1 Tax=Striga hermonthica TaxID=68872 RepID=A0A9N7NG19_STRHE|nr:Arabinogalactan peptide 12 [Striga hermonthica]